MICTSPVFFLKFLGAGPDPHLLTLLMWGWQACGGVCPWTGAVATTLISKKKRVVAAGRCLGDSLGVFNSETIMRSAKKKKTSDLQTLTTLISWDISGHCRGWGWGACWSLNNPNSQSLSLKVERKHPTVTSHIARWSLLLPLHMCFQIVMQQNAWIQQRIIIAYKSPVCLLILQADYI